ncbi:hypothetical protein OPT61_g6420 [Boeremia exigua]|uniref:Uncharacterized protein n=1 Tax=Boeremia exigua TaxID=749465 RepID=A0ACC2I6Q1_9PLEO|nr:hypothetical protein OPT61_g6420 [Boeremia exigua]
MSTPKAFLDLVPENEGDNVTLCQQCEDMFLPGKKRGKHHSSPESLERAHAKNCYLCTRLEKRFLGAVDKDLLGWPWAYVVERSQHYFGICIKSSTQKKGSQHYSSPHKTWLIAMHKATTTVDTNISHRREAQAITQSLQTARKWIKRCTDYHGTSGKRTCEAPSKPLWYPTRLLELGDSNVKMISTREISPSGHYVALSYCWGSAKFHRLLSCPEKELSFEKPISELETAFQEAIECTKGLNMRYIWIDCLCIVQNSLEDWKHESALMADVYSNCFVCLALYTAPNPTHHIQTPPGECSIPPFLTKAMFLTDGTETGVGGRGDYAIFSEDHFRRILYDQPLSTRAWCFQERIFSPRMLGFGRGELSWSCNGSQLACESFPIGLWIRAATIEVQLKGIFDESDAGVLRDSWLTILREYTSRDLTHPELDKITAMSSVANRMATALSDDYVAGHFPKSLPMSLNWRRNHGDSKTKRFPRKRPQDSDPRLGPSTPSWSWASMDGPILIPNWIDQDDCIAHIIECTSTGLSRNGVNVSATLQLRAPLAELCCLEKETLTPVEPDAWGCGTPSIEVWTDDAGYIFTAKYLPHGQVPTSSVQLTYLAAEYLPRGRVPTS